MWLYNNWAIDPVIGIEESLIADGVVIISCADLMGTRAFGVILDPAFNYGPLAFAPKTWVKEDPAQRLLMIQSSPLVISSRG
ncbi:major capsid protein [Serratia symbiotica]|nr:major capsid protein [Serratia symbiotica]